MKKIGQILKEIAQVPDATIDEALARQADDPRRIGEILVDAGALGTQELAFALMLQRLDLAGRTGFVSALRIVWASLRISPPSRRAIGVLAALSVVGGAISFPILFYFYSTWAWTVIGARLDLWVVARVGLATAGLVLLSNAIDYFISTSTSRTIAAHAGDLFRALHRRALQATGGADEAATRRSLAGATGHTVEQYASALTTLFMSGPRSLGTVVAGTVPIVMGNPGIALAAIAVAIPATLLPTWISSKANPYIRRESGAIAEAMAVLDPYFRHARTTSAFPLRTREKVAHAALRATHDEQLCKYGVWAVSGTVRGLFETLIPLAVAAYGGYLAIVGALAPSAVFGILVTVVLIVPRLKGLYETYLAAVNASQQALQLASIHFRVQRAPAAATAPRATPERFALDVRVDADDDRPETRWLRGRTFEFASGECVFVVGESGAGKTTLARIVAGFDDRPSTSSVRVSVPDGARVDVRPGDVAFIGSEPFFFEGVSTLRNLLLSDEPSPREAADVAAHVEALGLARTLEDVPAFARLSVGERQRLHLVRGLHARQRVRIFDEPTSALDPATSRAAQRLLQDVDAGHLHIVITHDRDWALASGCRIITITS
jgi:ABC-type multidrug transport system fused ATPase/permease subunit